MRCCPLTAAQPRKHRIGSPRGLFSASPRCSNDDGTKTTRLVRLLELAQAQVEWVIHSGTNTGRSYLTQLNFRERFYRRRRHVSFVDFNCRCAGLPAYPFQLGCLYIREPGMPSNIWFKRTFHRVSSSLPSSDTAGADYNADSSAFIFKDYSLSHNVGRLMAYGLHTLRIHFSLFRRIVRLGIACCNR